ncbi:MAG: PilT/PilU family type 4a pilus ATPase [Candidatus Dojkabacteria bacterium]|nr:PilT/PilU family type 4a pilus ATPase [Candidatus Dojkabacteria bacterium]
MPLINIKQIMKQNELSFQQNRENQVPVGTSNNYVDYTVSSNNSYNQQLGVETEFSNNLAFSNNVQTKNVSKDKYVEAFHAILENAIKLGASDIHINSGHPIIYRIKGKIVFSNTKHLTEQDTLNFVQFLISGSKSQLDINNVYDLDMSYQYQEYRFRINIFRTFDKFAIVCRLIPLNIPSLEDLHIPNTLLELTKLQNGLILFTGPTGSGKSTSVAAMLNLINESQSKHIITLEDPIEYVFLKKQSLVDQREYGSDFLNWNSALKSVLRQDPDIIFVGEIRDLDTMESVIKFAETGHLVFSTLHTNSASQSIDRILGMFPEYRRDDIKVQLSNVIKAIISQRLINVKNGQRLPVFEIMLSNSAIKNSIKENKISEIDNIIRTSADIGMISLERSLANLVKQGLLSPNDAMLFANNKSEISILLKNSIGLN